MEKDTKKLLKILIRYLFILLIAIAGFELFYIIFSPLTKYLTFWFLKIFYNPFLLGDSIYVSGKIIEIVGACVGTSAYYLLFVLSFSIGNIKINKRLKLMGTTFGLFFTINLIRIIILSFMFLNNSSIFDVTHEILWYIGGTVFVVLIWFFSIWMYKIDEIPFYTDLKELYSRSYFGIKN